MQYTCSEMAGGANHSRLTSIIYPNGRTLTYEYSGSWDGPLNDAGSRVYRILDSALGGAALEYYTYIGLGTVVQRTRRKQRGRKQRGRSSIDIRKQRGRSSIDIALSVEIASA